MPDVPTPSHTSTHTNGGLPPIEELNDHIWAVLRKRFGRSVDRQTLQELHSMGIEWWLSRGASRLREPEAWRGFVKVSVLRVATKELSRRSERRRFEQPLNAGFEDSEEERWHTAKGGAVEQPDDPLEDADRKLRHAQIFSQLKRRERAFLLVQLACEVLKDLKDRSAMHAAAAQAARRLLARDVEATEFDGTTHWQEAGALIASEMLGTTISRGALQTGVSKAKAELIERLGKLDAEWDAAHEAALANKQANRVGRAFESELRAEVQAAVSAWVDRVDGLVEPGAFDAAARRRGCKGNPEALAEEGWERLRRAGGIGGFYDEPLVRAKVRERWLRLHKKTTAPTATRPETRR